MSLNRTELIAEIASEKKLSKAVVKQVLEGFEDSVTNEMRRKGGRVALTGFMTFNRKEIAARNGTNPKTGECKEVPAHGRVGVKIGTVLKNNVKSL